MTDRITAHRLTHAARMAEVARLDPVRDAERIVRLLSCYEFPWDMTRALELALFRTFCSPAVSALLDHTGEFEARPQKRYDDTDILISLLLEAGYDSPRGRDALASINRQHGRFRIPNDEFLYVLSTFVFEPIRWNERFGWRRMTEPERLGLFHFWREVGRRMGIRDIPEHYAEFEAFNRQYEAEQFRYADSNRRIGTAVLDLFCSWFPGVPARLVRDAILSLLDPPVLAAFGFAPPAPAFRSVVLGVLRLRARLVSGLPKRQTPQLRTHRRHRSYPEGYTLRKLGPPDDHQGATEHRARSGDLDPPA